MSSGTLYYTAQLRVVPGVIGRVGSTLQKTWNGANTPHRAVRPPRSRYQSNTFYVRKGNKDILVTRKARFARFPPDALPPKRSRIQENPYACQIRYTSQVPFIWLPDGRTFSTEGAGYSCQATPGPSGPAALMAIGKLREAIAGSDFNAAISIGESGKAFDMITDSATRIYQALRRVRKGDVDGAALALTGAKAQFAGVISKTTSKRASQNIASNWLALQYGWLPLLKDVENAAQFLAHHYNVPLQKVVRVSAKTRIGGGSSSTAPSEVTAMKLYPFERVSIKAIIREKDVVQLAGLQDPLSLAWELLPYSFVVDWFIPIGNWLSARSLSSAVDGVFVTSTKLQNTTVGMTSLNGLHQGDIPSYIDTTIHFTRSVSNSLQVPLPEFKPFAKIASAKHCINAVALLVNLTKKD